MTVFVLDNDGGWDGFGPPLGAFTSLHDALAAYNTWAASRHLLSLTPMHFQRVEHYKTPLWTSSVSSMCIWEFELGAFYKD